MQEVLASVESLYVNELKPFGRVLLRRIRERAAARLAQAEGLPADAIDPESLPRINPRHLRRRCELCDQLSVAVEDAREYSVIVVGQPCAFLDACSPNDPYPQDLWEEMTSYMQSLGPADIEFPGGRYACARVLASRRLAFLEGRSLGQLCHIVQLAISQRRLLGKRGGGLVPYKYSEDWVKEQRAVAQSPMRQESCPVVTWEQASIYLRHLLSIYENEPSGITISNLKRLFRLHFRSELSETALGHVRLLDLLSDWRLHDVCALHVKGNGHFMVTHPWPEASDKTHPALAKAAERSRTLGCGFSRRMLDLSSTSEDASIPELLSPGASPRAASPLEHRDSAALTSHSARAQLDNLGPKWPISVKNTFINVCFKDSGVAGKCSKPRGRSLPAASGSLLRPSAHHS